MAKLMMIINWLLNK